MRIAFFGGSFDPPHLGHLRIALAAGRLLHLDRVLFAPVAVQPLKRGLTPPPASYADRLAMLHLLLQQPSEQAGEQARNQATPHAPHLEVSELDRAREDGRPNYTFETLATLRATLAPGDTLLLLTGADALLTLPHWHRALELVRSTGFIIAARPGFPLYALYPALLSLTHPSELRPAAQQQPGVEHLQLLSSSAAIHHPDKEEPACNLYVLTDLNEDISSTTIRGALAASPAAPQPDLTPQVAAYIREHGLYRQGN